MPVSASSRRTSGGWSRLGHIVLGVLFIIAGVIAFANLSQTTAWLAVFVGILVGILWIIEGVVSLSTLGDARSKGWTIFFAIISIIAGIVLLFSPLLRRRVLWWLLGIALVVLGIIQIVRAFSFGNARRLTDHTSTQEEPGTASRALLRLAVAAAQPRDGQLPRPPVQNRVEALEAVPRLARPRQLMVLAGEDQQLRVDAVALERRVVPRRLLERAAEVQLRVDDERRACAPPPRPPSGSAAASPPDRCRRTRRRRTSRCRSCPGTTPGRGTRARRWRRRSGDRAR